MQEDYIKRWLTWISFLGDAREEKDVLDSAREQIKEWAEENDIKASLFDSSYFKENKNILRKLRLEKKDGSIYWYNVRVWNWPVYRGDLRIRRKYRPYKIHDESNIFYYAGLERINAPQQHADKMIEEILY